MKKITFLIFISFLVAFTQLNATSPIWVNPLTTGRPITGTYYLGDKLVNYYFQFEIGQASWNKSEVGIGQNSDGSTGWNWADATSYKDNGGNKDVQRNLNGFQFTATGTWFVVGRARENAADAWTYADEGGWTNETTLTASTTNKSCPYFSVSALVAPTSPTAVASSTSQINLTWSQSNGKNVMIVARKTSDAPSDAPVQGTAYTVGTTLGTGRVVYNSNGTSTSITGLDANTSYTFAFYSENYSYYSTDNVTAVATTNNFPWFQDYVLINVNGAGTTEPTGHYWIGDDPNHAGSTKLDGTNLGTVTSLVIDGCKMGYWDGTKTRTGGAFYYMIKSADNSTKIVPETEVIWNQSGPDANNNYQGTVYGANIDLLSFSAIHSNTTYTLNIWAKTWDGVSSAGDSWLSNNGSNYKATFTTGTIVHTGVSKLESSLQLSGANGKVTARFDGSAQVELFNVSGQLMRSSYVSNEFSQNVQQGAYLLRINGKTHKVLVR